MKKTLSLCILAIFIGMIGTNVKPITLNALTLNAGALVDTAINAQPATRLVFSDEFNKRVLNTNKWMTQLQWGRINIPELQYYAPTIPFSFRDGVLRIKAQRKKTNDMDYFSGALITYRSFKFTYGIVQIRARVPAGRGLWPALWLLDHAGGAEEIDIMELLGHEPNVTYMTLHFPTWSGNKSIGSHYKGPRFSANFHTYSVDWRPDAIDWYIDGVKRYTLTSNIPSKPMYLIMNLAVGGYWPGWPNQNTEFPAYFQIDYVRIYQRK